MKLPADITQRTYGVHFDYTLALQIALDASLGYTEVKFSPPGANFERSGRDDARLGLTYALLAESSELPAVTARLGAIFAGGYDIPTTLPPINPGDGASGFELSLAGGKTVGEGFSVYGQLGYRNRNHGVPDDLFGNVGVAKQLGRSANGRARPAKVHRTPIRKRPAPHSAMSRLRSRLKYSRSCSSPSCCGGSDGAPGSRR